jgi:hypothetical protein
VFTNWIPSGLFFHAKVKPVRDFVTLAIAIAAFFALIWWFEYQTRPKEWEGETSREYNARTNLCKRSWRTCLPGCDGPQVCRRGVRPADLFRRTSQNDVSNGTGIYAWDPACSFTGLSLRTGRPPFTATRTVPPSLRAARPVCCVRVTLGADRPWWP